MLRCMGRGRKVGDTICRKKIFKRQVFPAIVWVDCDNFVFKIVLYNGFKTNKSVFDLWFSFLMDKTRCILLDGQQKIT